MASSSESIGTTRSMAASEITNWSASEIARRVLARQISAREVCQAHIDRCQAVNPQLNALVWTRYDEALREATVVDDKLARGETLGPLVGVPMTVKDCFFVKGATSTIGLTEYRGAPLEPSEGTNSHVQGLQHAGAILLGKTNVPQLMITHECDNPVYGRTNNPWSLDRSSGGSTGGEAAIIAASGSALGLGNDIGGSIRIPAHFCGIAGLKPTSHRLHNGDALFNFLGLEAMVSAVGPMARSVDDLDLAMRVLVSGANSADRRAESQLWRNYRSIDVSQLRIGVWIDEAQLDPSPAITRGVREAASALAAQGAVTDEGCYGARDLILDLYIGLIMADGGADLRRIVGKSKLDWCVRRSLFLAGLSRLSRSALIFALRAMGQGRMARLVGEGRSRSADEYWKLCKQRQVLADLTDEIMASLKLDAIISAPYALPAPQHGKGFDLLPGASYSFFPNLLGWPAGVVSVTTVRENEQNSRPNSRDIVLKQAAAVDAGSAGLPVGVQVFAPPWREDVVLAVMAAIERGCPRPQLLPEQLAAMGVQG